MKTLLLLSIIAILSTGCKNSNSYSPDSIYYNKFANEASSAYEDYETSVTDDEFVEKKQNYKDKIPDVKTKIIKTGNISIDVDNYKESIKNIKNTIKKFDAKIINEDETSYSYGISNDLQIQVKNNLFDSLVNVLTRNRNVTSKKISAQDVTEEYIDVKTRIENKKLVRDKYNDMLKSAKNIKEILMIEDKLRVIQEEIEAKEGRLKYLNNRTTYSTINLTINQENSNIYEPSFISKIGKGFKSGWNGLKIFFLIIIYLWPLWLILTGLYFWIRHIIKKRKLKKQAGKK